MSRRTLAIVAAAAIVGCDRPTAPSPAALTAGPSSASYAKAQTTKTNTSQEMTFAPIAACDGDVVAFRGSAHTVTTISTAGTTAHIDMHFNTQDVFGVGTSGTIYRLAEIYKIDEDIDLQGARAEEDFKGIMRVISRGNRDNFLLDATYHFSFDISPAGQPTNVTMRTIKMNARCRG